MNYEDALKIIESFRFEYKEEHIIREIKKIIADTRFSAVLQNYDMPRTIFIQVYDFAREWGYKKGEMLNYANKHNIQIINEVYDKMEIFK